MVLHSFIGNSLTILATIGSVMKASKIIARGWLDACLVAPNWELMIISFHSWVSRGEVSVKKLKTFKCIIGTVHQKP